MTWHYHCIHIRAHSCAYQSATWRSQPYGQPVLLCALEFLYQYIYVNSFAKGVPQPRGTTCVIVQSGVAYHAESTSCFAAGCAGTLPVCLAVCLDGCVEGCMAELCYLTWPRLGPEGHRLLHAPLTSSDLNMQSCRPRIQTSFQNVLTPGSD